MEQISRHEFVRAIDDLKKYVGERCDAIDGRLDKVNGRIDRNSDGIRQLEPAVARHGERLTGHDRDLGDLRSNARSYEPSTPHAHAILSPLGGDKKADSAELTISLTPRMWKILVAVGGGLLTFGPVLGEWLKDLVVKMAVQP
jgi:hypothetical protein